MLPVVLILLIPLSLFASELETICEVNNENLPEVTQIINTDLKVGILLVQFADAETNPINYDAKGGVGYDKHDNRVIDKYHYQDYWNIIFSFETYHDIDPLNDPQLHPDCESHGTGVWGSFKDYWWEVSRQNLEIIPAPTRDPGNQTGNEMKDTGIINNINPDGTIEWITLDSKKSDYSQNYEGVLQVLEDAWNKAKYMYDAVPKQLDKDVTNNTHFDKVLITFAGKNTFGPSTVDEIGGRYTISHERCSFGQTAHLAGFGVQAHEFGHLLGFDDFHMNLENQPGNGVGYFSLMGWGCSYEIGLFLPSHLDPYNKLKMGWLNYEIIESDKTDYVLFPVSDNSSTSNVCVIVNEGDPENNSWENGDYILLENRSGLGFDRRFTYDQGNNFTGGMVVWHYCEDELENGLKIKIVEADVDEEHWSGDGGIVTMKHLLPTLVSPVIFFLVH